MSGGRHPRIGIPWSGGGGGSFVAPTMANQYTIAFDWTTTPRTVVNAVAMTSGDVIIAAAAAESGGSGLPGITENGAASWVARQDSPTISGDWTAVRLDSYVVPANETLTVTATSTGSLYFGAACLRFTGSSAVGASNAAEGTTGAPAVTLTTTQDHSAIVVICGDWNAISGTQTFTSNGGAGSPTAVTSFPGDAAHYGVAVAYYADAGTAGSKTVGMSAPSGQKWSICALEVVGAEA